MVSKRDVEKVWQKAKPVRGKDPSLYRQDAYGDMIYKPSYGKSSQMGWEVDHITPSAKGGSDHIRNLQALKTSTNRSIGDSLKKKSRHSKSNK